MKAAASTSSLTTREAAKAAMVILAVNIAEREAEAVFAARAALRVPCRLGMTP